MTYDPLNFDWDVIFEELKKALEREPSVMEVQEELLKKYWRVIDDISQT